MAHGKCLDLNEIRPKRYIAARRDNGVRVTPDGTMYVDAGRGWRKLGRPAYDGGRKEQHLGDAVQGP